MRIFLCFTLCLIGNLQAYSKTTHLYNSLDPQSLLQLIAFYRLYPEDPEGKQALEQCWNLINKHRKVPVYPLQALIFPDLDVEPMVALITKQPHQSLTPLSTEAMANIEMISDHLHHRKLRGHAVENIQDLTALPDAEIDLARALFLFEFSEDLYQVRMSENRLDVMALQILGRLPPGATHRQKVDAITDFVFHEMGYRFPPHSLWAKEVDQYTYLPSVLDSRHGVCLGVSILYLCLAQRLDVPLEILTPPGHIFLRYVENGEYLNIETTARGIHVEDSRYLNIHTKALQRRNLKEVIGLYFMNAAATAWHSEQHHKALAFYKKSSPFMPDDTVLKRFMGYNYLFVGDKQIGEELLKFAYHHPLSEYLIREETIIEDYFCDRVDVAGIKLIFQEGDTTRDAIMDKQKALTLYLKQYPRFREGFLQLGVSYLQLGSLSEALEPFRQYHTLDPNNPMIEYYLTLIYMKRLNFPQAKEHLQQCRQLLQKQEYYPNDLKQLEEEWRMKAGFL